jgi:hypothetical protein
MELISRWFNLRARMLMKGIRRMLEDHVEPKGNWFQKSTLYNYLVDIASNIVRFFVPMKEREKVVRLFYNQPSIKYLGEDKSFSKPAYLQPHNFSNTIVQMLRGNSYDGSTNSEAELIKNALDNNLLNINQETLSHLKNLFADARQDAYSFRFRLEQWFEETMERANGWYKRQTQIILLVLGFFIACQFNVDSIAISKILLKDKKARDKMVELATSRKDNYGSINDSVTVIVKKTTKNLVTDTTLVTIDSMQLSSQGQYLDTAYQYLMQDAADAQHLLGLKGSENKYQKNKFLVFVGWLITAFAISLGAPFWFDLLNRVIKLRSSGQKPSGGNTSSSMSTPVVTSESKPIRG